MRLHLRAWLIACSAVVLSLCLSATSQAQVQFELRVPAAGTAHEQSEITIDQNLTISGQPLVVKSTRFAVTRVEAGAPDANGQVTIESALEALNVRLSLPDGSQLQYDSGGDAAPQASNGALQPVMDALHALSKSTWTTVIGQDGRVAETRGAGPVYEDGNLTQNPLLRDSLDVNYLTEQANAQRDRVPSTPVQVNDTWQRTYDMRIEGGQVLSFDVEYTYRGEQQRDGRTLDEIGVNYTAVRYSVASGLSQLSVKSSNLQIADSSGTLLFDRAAGQFVNEEYQFHITGDMKLTIGGNDLDATLDLTMSTRNSVGP